MRCHCVLSLCAAPHSSPALGREGGRKRALCGVPPASSSQPGLTSLDWGWRQSWEPQIPEGQNSWPGGVEKGGAPWERGQARRGPGAGWYMGTGPGEGRGQGAGRWKERGPLELCDLDPAQRKGWAEAGRRRVGREGPLCTRQRPRAQLWVLSGLRPLSTQVGRGDIRVKGLGVWQAE